MLSISEIVRKAQKLETEEQKIEWLRANDSVPLRQLLICTYDTDRIKFLIPNTAPPYKKSEHLDSQGMLYRQIRKLQYVIEGEAPQDRLTPYKREWIFIEILETVDAEDAELLCEMIQQKPLTGLTVNVINKAFGDIISKKFEIVETPVKPKAPVKVSTAKKANKNVKEV